MKKKPTFNILMYSHDTYGLGHIRRTMAIASQLKRPDINILILTGSPIAGRFTFPEQVDFVRIPGMIKKTNKAYEPLSIKIHPTHALNIRKNIITTTAKTFQPDLFIVDKEPFGLKKEVLPTLQWLKKNHPKARTVLGLRDIMDDAQTVKDDWKAKGIYAALESLYSEIWVYGDKEVYDPAIEYDISPSVREKMIYTGYIKRNVADKQAIEKIREEHQVLPGEKLIVVTTGGGGDGYPLMDHYLSMLDLVKERSLPHSIKSVLVTGPFMPERQQSDVFNKSREKNIYCYPFFRQMEKLIAAADLVISMGGYNTLCEILSQNTLSLIVPRETPRMEQLIRAKAFHKKHLVEYIQWDQCTPDHLLDKMMYLLNHKEKYHQAIQGFPLTGIEKMCLRINAFSRKKIRASENKIYPKMCF